MNLLRSTLTSFIRRLPYRENPPIRDERMHFDARQESPWEEFLLSVFQATAGACFSCYTFRNTSRNIWPFMGSMVALYGTCKVFKCIQKMPMRAASWINPRLLTIGGAGFFIATAFGVKASKEISRNVLVPVISVGGVLFFLGFRAVLNINKELAAAVVKLLVGIVVVSLNLYFFSTSWEDDKTYILCLPLAFYGYKNAVSAMDRLYTFSRRNPFLKCCKIAFQPFLIGCSATFFFYIQQHKEKWLQLLIFVVAGEYGWKIVSRGIRRDVEFE